ncbi:hypothetical protein I317_02000 [Kwoniella heveanensis CBS 569]|uniref:Uncharacterized protein n=1 Tax=Kwoniella heveanensis BCC8398 TaxID=1296120 RepID=A0A1B9GZD8_9TREE|nr:hypothetical protein I316_01639 [Kwoniella heveanensis BCC8398]OCF44207.1 hypothetical protein I317_02000 [Kwoniella heveanensis CBS 569]
MNTAPLARVGRSTVSRLSGSASAPASVRCASSQAGPSSSSTATSSYPPKKSDGRTLPASTLRSLVSLHHTSAGFLQNPQDIAIGFENAFRHTKAEPNFQGYYDFATQVSENQSQHPTGGIENLVEKPRSPEARGSVFRGSQSRHINVAETVQPTFKDQTANTEELWSQRGDQSRGFSRRDQFLSERELRVQEALYGTWERGGAGMDRVEPGLEGVLEFVQAKGKSVGDYAKEWERRNEAELDGVNGNAKSSSTEDGQ